MPFLHATFSADSWIQHLCPELQVALLAMMTAEPLRVAELGEENVKDPGLVAILDRMPSERARAAARRATSSYRLNHLDDGIGCPVHHQRIDWTAAWLERHRNDVPSLRDRLRALVGRVH
ncbi:hypothetical protein HJG53_09955 [Sphingomonas sp. ID1715]|uniref:hypothetical protein n=1 Tax=Sphingomonas sp. ID1715 TaxID=1656898 RepID=UPI001488257E|nr:hypothetical protein [Sphingomonas sp. ID1715]NNM77226.1 hypothetical protein [Sphingomonas sp. ID1715]